MLLLQVSTNDNLEVMMEKSKHNKLGEDGLSTLHYEVNTSLKARRPHKMSSLEFLFTNRN